MSQTLQVRVVRRAYEAEDVVSLRLQACDGGALPAFEAGAHVDVHLGDGLVRQYSLCNSPISADGYELGVLLVNDSRGGSCAVHALREGDELAISAPRNLFPVVANAAHHLLLGGGIGITPLLSMAESMHAHSKPFQLHACARSAERLPFRSRLSTSAWSTAVVPHIDGPDGSPSHSLQRIIAEAPAGTHVYACGPAGFIEAARHAAQQAGLADSAFHCESFSAEVTPQAGDRAFEVELNDGRVLQVAADQTVAQCLEAHGVFLPLSCEQGICGTCITPIRGGIPDHRDSYLTDQERESNLVFTPCCSRARTPRLVLDLDT